MFVYIFVFFFLIFPLKQFTGWRSRLSIGFKIVERKKKHSKIIGSADSQIERDD